MTLVVDASVVVAALLDGGADGKWAEEQLLSGDLAAPHLMPAEVANILRRALLAKEVSQEIASLAHADLLSLAVELFPYEPLGPQIRELRKNITPYDAWYVALAESLGAPLATLDKRLTRSVGPRCELRTPR